jgi:hypothetical protein
MKNPESGRLVLRTLRFLFPRRVFPPNQQMRFGLLGDLLKVRIRHGTCLFGMPEPVRRCMIGDK